MAGAEDDPVTELMRSLKNTPPSAYVSARGKGTPRVFTICSADINLPSRASAWSGPFDNDDPPPAPPRCNGGRHRGMDQCAWGCGAADSLCVETFVTPAFLNMSTARFRSSPSSVWTEMR